MLHKGTVLKTVEVLDFGERMIREDELVDVFGFSTGMRYWSAFVSNGRSLVKLIGYMPPENKEAYVKHLWNKYHKYQKAQEERT